MTLVRFVFRQMSKKYGNYRSIEMSLSKWELILTKNGLPFIRIHGNNLIKHAIIDGHVYDSYICNLWVKALWIGKHYLTGTIQFILSNNENYNIVDEVSRRPLTFKSWKANQIMHIS